MSSTQVLEKSSLGATLHFFQILRHKTSSNVNMFGNFSEEILSQHPNKAPPTNWFKFTKFSPPKKIQSRTGIETLVLRDDFNQNLQGVTFPSSLEHLTLGKQCNQNLRSVHLPEGLQTLTLGDLVGLHLWQVAGRWNLPLFVRTKLTRLDQEKGGNLVKSTKKVRGYDNMHVGNILYLLAYLWGDDGFCTPPSPL